MTTSIGCRYVQQGNCDFDWDTGFDICHVLLKCEEKTAIADIAVRNCGNFYVYKSRPLPHVERPDKVGIYCGTPLNITKGNHA